MEMLVNNINAALDSFEETFFNKKHFDENIKSLETIADKLYEIQVCYKTDFYIIRQQPHIISIFKDSEPDFRATIVATTKRNILKVCCTSEDKELNISSFAELLTILMF